MTKTKKITLTALFLALAVVFQNLRILPFLAPNLPHSQFIIGSLVNLVLIISVAYVGIGGSFVIAIATPLISALQGHLPNIALAPAVMVGNMLMPFVWYMFNAKRKVISQFVSVILGSLAKATFLFFAMPFAFKMFVAPNIPPLFLLTFSWPQLVTALIGGTLALIIIRIIPDVN